MNHPQRIRWTAGLGLALALMCAAPLSAAGVAEPLDRPALMSPHAAQSALMDVTMAGKRLVAVGERGIIVLSDDDGKSWRQARVPVSVTLNAVRFASEKLGWAVGHYGVVLHSEDGGESWSRQLDGTHVAKLMLDAAQARAKEAGADQPSVQKQLAEAERLVKDGPDKPFFDLHFDNATNGFIVGAYNLIFATSDGGKTWQPLSERIDNPKSAHLYAIRAKGSQIYLAGEQGLFLRSDDGGKSFKRIELPYKGSYFAAAVYPTGELVVAGLRGNAYRSADHGASWEKIEVGAPVSITTTALTANGTLVLANQAGQVFVSRDRGRTLQALPTAGLPPLTKIEPLPDGSLIATGLRGVLRIPASEAVAKASAGQ